MPVKPPNHEVERLRRVYQSYREDSSVQARWEITNPGNQAIIRERQKVVRTLLQEHGFWPLNKLRILDVGCGSGDVLAGLLEWGARAENLYGVDLLPDRIEEAKNRYPNLHFQCVNAEHLEFSNNSFDLVLLFTVFSSILDESMAQNVAREIKRILKPAGAVLWYDFRYKRPDNPHVRAMTRHHIHRFFSTFSVHIRSITLLPPLARRLGVLTPLVYPILSSFPPLRSHYIGLLINNKE